MNVYALKPDPFLIRLKVPETDKPRVDLSCVGFDGGVWRGKGFVNHLMDWLADYALDSDQLKQYTHVNGWTKMREAAVRIYTTEYPEKRGEIGEISLHAICRQHFDTIPLVPRVFYLSSSNDVVKGFDLVHYRAPPDGSDVEIWLGESKFYENRQTAIVDALRSVRLHIDHGFLKKDKLLIGPQIPDSTPRYEEVRALFKDNTPIDQLKAKAIFPVGIFAESAAVMAHSSHCAEYMEEIAAEVTKLTSVVAASGLIDKLTILLIYVPLLKKSELIKNFDTKLKAIQDD